MTKKEFMTKYGIKRTPKHDRILNYLFKADNLDIESYIDFTISDQDISDAVLTHRRTITKWKLSGKAKDTVYYRALKSEAVRLTVAKIRENLVENLEDKILQALHYVQEKNSSLNCEVVLTFL